MLKIVTHSLDPSQNSIYRELSAPKVANSIKNNITCIEENLLDIFSIPPEKFTELNLTILDYHSWVVLLSLIPENGTFPKRIIKDKSRIDSELRHMLQSKVPLLAVSEDFTKEFSVYHEKAKKDLFNKNRPANSYDLFINGLLPFRYSVIAVAEKEKVDISDGKVLEKVQRFVGRTYKIKGYKTIKIEQIKQQVNNIVKENYSCWKSEIHTVARIEVISDFYEVIGSYVNLISFDTNSSLMDFVSPILNPESLKFEMPTFNKDEITSEHIEEKYKIEKEIEKIPIEKDINESISEIVNQFRFKPIQKEEGATLIVNEPKKIKRKKQRTVKTKYLTSSVIGKIFKEYKLEKVSVLIPFPEKNMIYKFMKPDKPLKLQESEDFLWDGIQLCQSKYTPTKIKLKIDGNTEIKEYEKRTFSCKGIKRCPVDGCNFAIGFKSKSLCPTHQRECQPFVCSCPVKVCYLKEINSTCNTQYLLRSDNTDHNHLMFTQHWRGFDQVRNDIKNVFVLNPTALPKEVESGFGLPYTPGIIDPYFQTKGVIANIKKRVIEEVYPNLKDSFDFLDNSLGVVLKTSSETLSQHIYQDCKDIHKSILKEFEEYIQIKKTFLQGENSGNVVMLCTTKSLLEIMNLSIYLNIDTTWKSMRGLYETDVDVYCNELDEGFTVCRFFHNIDDEKSKYIFFTYLFDAFKKYGSTVRYLDFVLVKDGEKALQNAWIKMCKNRFKDLNLTDDNIINQSIIECKVHFLRNAKKKQKKLKKDDKKEFKNFVEMFLNMKKEEFDSFMKEAVKIEGTKSFWKYHLKNIAKLNKNFSENPYFVNGKVDNTNLVERNNRFLKGPRSNAIKEGKGFSEAVSIDIRKVIKYKQKQKGLFSLSRSNINEIKRDRNRAKRNVKKNQGFIPQVQSPPYATTKIKNQRLILKIKKKKDNEINIGSCVSCYDGEKEILQGEILKNEGIFFLIYVTKIIDYDYDFLRMKNNSNILHSSINWEKNNCKLFKVKSHHGIGEEIVCVDTNNVPIIFGKIVSTTARELNGINFGENFSLVSVQKVLDNNFNFLNYLNFKEKVFPQSVIPWHKNSIKKKVVISPPMKRKSNEISLKIYLKNESTEEKVSKKRKIREKDREIEDAAEKNEIVSKLCRRCKKKFKKEEMILCRGSLSCKNYICEKCSLKCQICRECKRFGISKPRIRK